MSVATPWLNFTTASAPADSTRLCADPEASIVQWSNPSNALAAGSGEAIAHFAVARETTYLELKGLSGLASALPETANRGPRVAQVHEALAAGNNTIPAP